MQTEMRFKDWLEIPGTPASNGKVCFRGQAIREKAQCLRPEMPRRKRKLLKSLANFLYGTSCILTRNLVFWIDICCIISEVQFRKFCRKGNFTSWYGKLFMSNTNVSL